MKYSDIIDTTISFTPHFGKIPCDIKLINALDEIKSGCYQEKIIELRATEDDELWGIRKSNLPAYFFSGQFNKQNDNALINYSSFCILDFDHVGNKDIEDIKQKIFSNPYIFAIWISPSGTGLKALVYFDFSNCSIQTNTDYIFFHKEAYGQFRNSQKFVNDLELDATGCNISRICFVSYDPNLLIKESFKPFIVSDIQQVNVIKKNKHKNAKHKKIDESQVKNICRHENVNRNRHIMRSIYKYLRKRNLSITNSYNEWYRIGQAIANCFSYSIGKDIFLKLCRLDNEKHDEYKSKEKIIECYSQSETYDKENKLKMRTIIQAAMKQGWRFGNNRE